MHSFGPSILYYQHMSLIYNFTSAPPLGPNVSFKFIAYGDMGVTPKPGAYATAQYALEEVKNGSRFVVHIGDVSYARGQVNEFLHFILLVYDCDSDSVYTVEVFFLLINSVRDHHQCLCCFNPLSPKRDLNQIFHCNIKGSSV